MTRLYEAVLDDEQVLPVDQVRVRLPSGRRDEPVLAGGQS
jgi:hypothetical protein